ncbi:hypothetical protein B0H10DRAFT_1280704 [Mycena sp. CBHHK59/15]|nr:hypothetical protein B0H10DRAFT_1280704 [Mycena sp. CBHHK59/15]
MSVSEFNCKIPTDHRPCGAEERTSVRKPAPTSQRLWCSTRCDALAIVQSWFQSLAL